jgi:hypothetical protein
MQEGLEQQAFQTVLRTGGETLTIQDWLELDFSSTEEEIAAVNFFFTYFHQHYLYY